MRYCYRAARSDLTRMVLLLQAVAFMVRFRMLLGRKALRGQAIVDVSLSHAAGLPYVIAPELPESSS